MFINHIEDIKHNCPPYILNKIINTLSYVKSDPTDFKTPTLAELIKAQSKEVFCHPVVKQIGTSAIQFPFIKDGLIIWRALINRAAQKLIP